LFVSFFRLRRDFGLCGVSWSDSFPPCGCDHQSLPSLSTLCSYLASHIFFFFSNSSSSGGRTKILLLNLKKKFWRQFFSDFFFRNSRRVNGRTETKQTKQTKRDAVNRRSQYLCVCVYFLYFYFVTNCG
jgi:hypothetical protein